MAGDLWSKAMVLNSDWTVKLPGAFKKHLCLNPTPKDSDYLVSGGIEHLKKKIFPNDFKMQSMLRITGFTQMIGETKNF